MPSARAVDPLIEEIPVGTELVRVYDRAYGPLDFNPTGSQGRFRPILDAGGAVVPTAYVASDRETALAEALLRGATALGRGAVSPRLYGFQVDAHDVCVLRAARPIRVARLHGPGLTRLRLLREHVVDCGEADYAYTASWAQALWGCSRRPHGIAWTSRQNDSGRAYVLWSPRLRGGVLEHVGRPMRLDREPGRDLVRQACVAAGIDFES